MCLAEYARQQWQIDEVTLAVSCALGTPLDEASVVVQLFARAIPLAVEAWEARQEAARRDRAWRHERARHEAALAAARDANAAAEGKRADAEAAASRLAAQLGAAEARARDADDRVARAASSMGARPPVPPMPSAALAATAPPLRCGRVVVGADGAARVAWT